MLIVKIIIVQMNYTPYLKRIGVKQQPVSHPQFLGVPASPDTLDYRACPSFFPNCFNQLATILI